MKEGKTKVLFPDGLERIEITKDSYDRLYGDMTLENIELKEEIERLKNKVEELMELYTTEREVKEDYKSIIKEVREYIEELNDYGIGNNAKKELLEILEGENK